MTTPQPDPIVVDVTAEDIALGVRMVAASCPIAMALKRQGFKHVSVSTGYACVNFVLYNLPKVARHFVANFDDMKPVTPFKFRLSERE